MTEQAPRLRAVEESFDEPDAPMIAGLTPPKRSGGSGRFVTDVLVDLGFADKTRIQRAIEEAKARGMPPERLMVEESTISPEQLSRAMAERYGLDHLDLGIFKVDMSAANLLSARRCQTLRRCPGRRTWTTGHCWWRCPIPPTCWRSTTSRC